MELRQKSALAWRSHAEGAVHGVGLIDVTILIFQLQVRLVQGGAQVPRFAPRMLVLLRHSLLWRLQEPKGLVVDGQQRSLLLRKCGLVMLCLDTSSCQNQFRRGHIRPLIERMPCPQPGKCTIPNAHGYLISTMFPIKLRFV